MINSGKSSELRGKMLDWFGEVHPHLVELARLGYARDGRGCVSIEAPRGPCTNTPAEWFAAREIATDPATENLQRLVNTYDPQTQFVAVIRLEGESTTYEMLARVCPAPVVKSGDAIH